MTTTAFEVRRDSLRRLILDKFDGNRAAFARAAGVHQNQINLILTDNPDHQRNLGEGLARRMEAELGIAPGFFDQPSANSPSGRVTPVPAGIVPENLSGILLRDDAHAGTLLYQSYLEQFAGKVSANENLQLFRIGTKDMEPELAYGDHIMVDMGVKTITNDGVYILGHGNDLFLRRVQKQLTGGWVVSTPSNSEPLKMDSFKRLRAAGRVVMVSRHVIL